FDRRFQQHASGSVFADYFVGNGIIDNRYLDEIFLGVFDRLFNGVGYFDRFAGSHADFAFTVADNRDDAETITAAAFDDFRDMINADYAFFKLLFSTMKISSLSFALH